MSSRGRRAGTTVVVVVAALAVLVLVLFLPGDTSQVRGLADRLDVPVDWSLVEERVTPPRRACLDASPCPSLLRTWTVGGNLTADALRQLVAQAGWDLELDGTCAIDAGSVGRHEVCSAVGVVDGFHVTVAHDGSLDRPEEARVRLDVRPT
jgi:hypothetical protein